MYKVEITDQYTGDGAYRTDPNLAMAICKATMGASAITSKALVVGVLAWAILEEQLEPTEAKAARALIDQIGVPLNMRELVDLVDI